MEQNVWDTLLQFRYGKYQTPGFSHLERQGRCQGDPEKERSSVPHQYQEEGGEVPEDFPTRRWRSAAGKQDQKKKPDPGLH